MRPSCIYRSLGSQSLVALGERGADMHTPLLALPPISKDWGLVGGYTKRLRDNEAQFISSLKTDYLNCLQVSGTAQQNWFGKRISVIWRWAPIRALALTSLCSIYGSS